MANSSSIKKIKKREQTKPAALTTKITMPLGVRRAAAWFLEVSLVTASAIIPYGIGSYVSSQAKQVVPLHPILAETHEIVAKTLALPKQESYQPSVAPVANLLYWLALISPGIIIVNQGVMLATKGQTWSKRWLQVRVVDQCGNNPGLTRIVVREALGRWGLPVTTAYVIWRYAGAFPDLGILSGLTVVMLLAEASVALWHRKGRSWHDRIAGTLVIDSRQPYTPPQIQSETPITLDLKSLVGELRQQQVIPVPPDNETTTITKSGIKVIPKKFGVNLWQLMRKYPGLTLLIATISGLTAILGTFVGTQIYIQGQANHREAQKQQNQLFLTLVAQLSKDSDRTTQERRAAILALSTLDDARVIPLLVDLLGQETNIVLLDTLQQVMASRGLAVLPALISLNQSLNNDYQALAVNHDNPEVEQILALRLQTTKRAIAKIINLDSGQLTNFNLQKVNLGGVQRGSSQFSLVLDKVNLSGINFRSSILNNASLQGSVFYSPGQDKTFGTFDDLIADLSGVDLKEANLRGAFLHSVALNRTNLMRSYLKQANLNKASLIGANLSSANLIKSNLQEADLEEASLTGADLGEATLMWANLYRANLGQIRAIDANFSYANLSSSNLQGADLSSANLNHAHLDEADLSNSQLWGANLRLAQLKNANLQNANLSNADLRGANLDGADLQDADFVVVKPPRVGDFVESVPLEATQARIKGVNFSQVKNLSATQITFICSQGGIHPDCR